jgi:hypothetical protein
MPMVTKPDLRKDPDYQRYAANRRRREQFAFEYKYGDLSRFSARLTTRSLPKYMVTLRKAGNLVRVAFWVGQLSRVLTLIQSAAALSGMAVSIEGSAGAGALEVKTPVDSAPAGVARFVADLRAGLQQLERRPRTGERSRRLRARRGEGTG